MLEIDISEVNPVINNNCELVKRGIISGHLTNNDDKTECNVTIYLKINEGYISFVNIDNSNNLKTLTESRAVFFFDKIEPGTSNDWKIGIHVLNPVQKDFRYSITAINGQQQRIYSSSDNIVLIKKSDEIPLVDTDNDMLTDKEELILNTYPTIDDSDDDGIIDGLDLDNALESSLQEPSLNIWCDDSSIMLGEEIVLSSCITNIITKPEMSAQIILNVPSGISVKSSYFVNSGSGEYTSSFEQIAPGNSRFIEVSLKPENAGEYLIKSRFIYYFDGNTSSAQYKSIPIIVKVTEQEENQIKNDEVKIKTSPSFSFLATIISVIMAILYSKKMKC